MAHHKETVTDHQLLTARTEALTRQTVALPSHNLIFCNQSVTQRSHLQKQLPVYQLICEPSPVKVIRHRKWPTTHHLLFLNNTSESHFLFSQFSFTGNVSFASPKAQMWYQTWIINTTQEFSTFSWNTLSWNNFLVCLQNINSILSFLSITKQNTHQSDQLSNRPLTKFYRPFFPTTVWLGRSGFRQASLITILHVLHFADKLKHNHSMWCWYNRHLSVEYQVAA